MKSNTKQTNIRMSEDLLKALKRKASKEDKSLAELIRELGRAYVSGEVEIRENDIKADPIWSLADKGVSLGESDLSQNIDAVLYE